MRVINPSSHFSGDTRSSISHHQFPMKMNFSHKSVLVAAASTTPNTTITTPAKPLSFLPNLFTSLTNIISHSSNKTNDKDESDHHHKPNSTIQTLHVYELNEGDRHSPAFLKLSKNPEKCLGDLVPFSNKLYSGDLKTRLGISAGMIIYIEEDLEAGDRYEAIYSFYFGSYGHFSAQGPYFARKDSELVVTGGTGIFEGVTGKAKLSNVIYPLKLYYVFELKGIKETLPKELVGGHPVKPTVDVKAADDAKPLVL